MGMGQALPVSVLGKEAAAASRSPQKGLRVSGHAPGASPTRRLAGASWTAQARRT